MVKKHTVCANISIRLQKFAPISKKQHEPAVVLEARTAKTVKIGQYLDPETGHLYDIM